MDFVVGQFADHGIILLGETHHVAENCAFVAALIKPLHAGDVNVLVWEFTRSRLNDDLRRLVTAEPFDDELAMDLFREGPWPTWGYEEYVEILRAAWRLNRRLPAGQPPFLVVGMDSGWNQYHPPGTKRTPQVRFAERIAREQNMVNIVRDNSVEQGRKALVYAGRDHTNMLHGFRLGKKLTDQYAGYVKQVVLHHVWPGRTGPAPITRVLEWLARDVGDCKPIGFEIARTPLDSLIDPSVVYWTAIPDATLSSFAQSYVVLAPLNELHGMTWLRGFITDEHLVPACDIAVRFGWVENSACTDAETLDEALAAHFYGGLRENPQ